MGHPLKQAFQYGPMTAAAGNRGSAAGRLRFVNQKLAAYGSRFAASETRQHTNQVWQRKGEAWEQLGADAEVKEIRSIDLTCSKETSPFLY